MDPASSSTRSSPAFSLRFFCRDKSGPSADWNIERLNLPCKGQREKEDAKNSGVKLVAFRGRNLKSSQRPGGHGYLVRHSASIHSSEI